MLDELRLMMEFLTIMAEVEITADNQLAVCQSLKMSKGQERADFVHDLPFEIDDLEQCAELCSALLGALSRSEMMQYDSSSLRVTKWSELQDELRDAEQCFRSEQHILERLREEQDNGPYSGAA